MISTLYYMKTKLLILLLACGSAVLASCEKEKETDKDNGPDVEQPEVTAPEHAMSDKIWIVGEGEGGVLQYWSDAIRIPECNKAAFEGGGTPQEPISDCRNNFSRTDLGYFYTAEYVIQNADLLCPDGWRVPSREDFAQLDRNLGGTGRTEQEADGTARYNGPEWGGVLGGVAWSDTAGNPDYDARAYYRGLPAKYESEMMLMYDEYGVFFQGNQYYYGAQVRCVK